MPIVRKNLSSIRFAAGVFPPGARRSILSSCTALGRSSLASALSVPGPAVCRTRLGSSV
jgi:hypothetical protein